MMFAISTQTKCLGIMQTEICDVFYVWSLGEAVCSFLGCVTAHLL